MEKGRTPVLFALEEAREGVIGVEDLVRMMESMTVTLGLVITAIVVTSFALIVVVLVNYSVSNAQDMEICSSISK